MRRSPYSALPLLIFLSVLELLSGYFLGSIEEELISEPALLILVPVVIAIGGNLGSLLSSRLSTQLHLGIIDKNTIKSNITAVLALSATLFISVGFITYFISIFQGGTISLSSILLIAVCSGTVLTIVSITISISSTFISRYIGLDPDDVVIPVVTVICDILGIASFVAIIFLLDLA